MKINILSPDDNLHRVHTYFKGSPYHPDGKSVLYTRFETGGTSKSARWIWGREGKGAGGRPTHLPQRLLALLL